MKIIRYQLCTEINHGTEDEPDIQQVFSAVTLGWSAANEAIAKAEAYKGEYTVEDDGEPEPVIPPTNEALAADIAVMQSVNSIVFVTLTETGSIDPVTASEHTELFSPWAYPVNYKTGNIRERNGKLYKCLQDHNSQETWTPENSPSLWVAISDPAEEWPEWSQPVGSTDAYAKGDKVSHSGKHWVSSVNSNVWEPGVYGWTEVTEHE